MRLIYKIEREEEYVIWCNTVDMLMPNMFDSEDSARMWLDKIYTDEKLFKEFKNFQGVVSIKDIEESLK